MVKGLDDGHLCGVFPFVCFVTNRKPLSSFIGAYAFCETMIILIGNLVNNISFFILCVYTDWCGVGDSQQEMLTEMFINLTCSMFLLISADPYKEIILFFGHHKFLYMSPELMYSIGMLTSFKLHFA